MKNAVNDLKYLLNQNYRKKIALNFVANHYLLSKEDRHYLARSIFSDALSKMRKSKIINLKNIQNHYLFLDGYNVLITVEAIINHDKVILSDDGFLRDFLGIFGNYKLNSNTKNALSLIFKCISQYPPQYIKFYLDKQVSFSGKLSHKINKMFKNHGLNGTIVLSKEVDSNLVHECNEVGCIGATSDGIMIDKLERVVDIPSYILDNMENLII
ncbi:MAG: DUF434 domain-containing protein [Methanobacteriaceae archaeon]|nr:DUF434 domain-containing protein [Methanobacteriaceae archaeon]